MYVRLLPMNVLKTSKVKTRKHFNFVYTEAIVPFTPLLPADFL